MRCKDCGDVRWSFRGFVDGALELCELCGGEMTPERRLPTHAAPVTLERRDVHEHAEPVSR